MTVTRSQLAAIMPQAAKAGRIDTWYPYLSTDMPAHGITTPTREAMFVATIAEETGELSAQVEASYYSSPWARVAEVFGAGRPGGVSGLTEGLFNGWKQLGRQGFDEAFFNHLYSDHNRPPGYRVGNVNPGDGWRYRGRGPMGLTGKQNYERFFRDLGMPADSDPDLVSTPEIGCKSACHFWQKNGCNEIADTGDFYALTKRVNGTHMNMNLRLPYYQRATQVLAAPVPPVPTPPPGTKRTETGNIVIEDIDKSTIKRDAEKGAVESVVKNAGVLATVGTVFSQFSWQLALVITGGVLLGFCAWELRRFLRIRAARMQMHQDGVA